MKRPVLFYIAALLAVLCVLLAAYYTIPGIYHPFFAISDKTLQFVDPNKHPLMVKSAHHKYSVALIGLAVLFALIAFLFRGRKAIKIA